MATNSGDESVDNPLAFGAPRPPLNFAQITSLAILVAAAAFGTYIVTAGGGHGQGGSRVPGFFLLALAIGGAFVIPIRAFTLARLRRAAPGQIVFTLGSTGRMGSVLKKAFANEPLGKAMSGFSVSVAASADAKGITFWDSNPPQPIGLLPWSVVRVVFYGDYQPAGNFAFASRPYGAVLIGLDDAHGTVALPLDGANASLFPGLISGVSANWIAQQLELLLLDTGEGRS